MAHPCRRSPKEASPLDKPSPRDSRQLKHLLHKTLGEAFAKQGFASVELVTRWGEIVGAEIAAHTQPEKIQWPRMPQAAGMGEPGTLVLRVEGPIALEIQHLSDVILQQVNRFFGWQAVASLRLRQAPLSRGSKPRPPVAPEPCDAERLAAQLPEIKDPNLRAALARLGAAVGRG
jgi:hypothetical protein